MWNRIVIDELGALDHFPYESLGFVYGTHRLKNNSFEHVLHPGQKIQQSLVREI